MKLTDKQLERAIAALADANNKAQKARDRIMEHCRAVYGVEPGEVDNDTFIDTVDGGCGSSTPMTAEEFDQSMLECIARSRL